MATELKLGDEVRIIKNGIVGILVDVNPHENFAELEEYWGEISYGEGLSVIIDKPEDVVLLRLAADIPPQLLPTSHDLREFVANALLSNNWGGEAIELDETDVNEPEGQLLAFGKSASGQRFGFRVTLSEITEADQ